MSDLKNSVKNRKAKDEVFAKDYECGYSDFKLGVMLRQAREHAGLTQLRFKSEDIRLSTLEKVAEALGETLKLSMR